MADLIARPEPMPLSPSAVRWTRADCESLERAGVLNYRYELVEGVINRKGQNLGHAGIVQRVLAWLFAAFGSQFVLTQMTIDVRADDNPTSQPEPDVILLMRPDLELSSNPRPLDIRLLVEASDSTPSYDLTVKARLYARAGIPEYWVVSLPERRVHVHRLPVEGAYSAIASFAEDEQVTPTGAEYAVTTVSSLLPAPID